MIIYQNKLRNFVQDVSLNQISELLYQGLKRHHITGGSPSEINSWNNSLHFMKDVLDTPSIPGDCTVAIEYNIPQTSKRVDFMVLGQDREKEDHIVIVELKQWAKVEKVDDWSRHSVMSDLKAHEPVAHPSYQAYSYKSLILNYCDMKGLRSGNLNPCTYLHNLREKYRPILEDELYSDWVSEAPVFLSNDVLKLRAFVSRYITKRSADDQLLYNIDFGRIKPSKSLQDSIDSMLCGNEEFKMIDEQAVAYDFIMKGIRKAQKHDGKYVMIIAGGPGTGKSVLAINLLADCIRNLQLNASYITKTSTPRKCYSKLLARGNAKKEVDLELAIRSPACLPEVPENGIDVGIFDEAHRMAKRPYQYYKGQDMLRDAIKACKVSVFFVDDDQRVTTKDCYSAEIIQKVAEEAGAKLLTKKPYELQSQFRCNGNDGYIAFLDYLLEIRDTANKELDIDNFDFRVYDTPLAMKDALKLADAGKNRSRMCAGYCYDWNVENGRGEWDVIIGDFKAKWNIKKKFNIFAVDPASFDQIGCIHTVQGMEFDYVGVIIGKDLVYRNGRIVTDRQAISKDDKSSGIRTCKDEALADRLLRNTYKVLLTRGQKGCFVYAEDDALRHYLQDRIASMKRSEIRDEISNEKEEESEEIDFERFVYLPVVGEIAAGHEHFMEEEIEEQILVEKSRLHPPEPGKYFFLSVSGDSMTGAGIEDGDRVLIRRMSNMRDLKNGDIVAAMIHGEMATLKTYYREADGIRLQPENDAYEPYFITFEEFAFEDARIIGKMIRY